MRDEKEAQKLKRPVCPVCCSGSVLYRLKTNSFVCRRCGKIWNNPKVGGKAKRKYDRKKRKITQEVSIRQHRQDVALSKKAKRTAHTAKRNKA